VAEERIDAQLARMREMHDRLAKATTPAQREALMTEHMQVMQDGMTMMREMSSGSMGDDEMGVGMAAGAMGGNGTDAGMHERMGPGMAAHHGAMHRRMQMMEAMMQMMMDRLAEPPASH
jgi:hypothetical protein